MKILFTVQGEGRGHLTQALTLRRMLAACGHDVVGVVVGKSPARRVPAFFLDKIDAPVYYVESPNFLPAGARKRPPLGRSILYNVARLGRFRSGVRQIRHLARQVDVVVNFYELLTGLAYGLGGLHTPLVCIGHQYLFLLPDFHFPPGHRVPLWLLRLYTRGTAFRAKRLLALSFRPADCPEGCRIRVVPPLLREAVRQARPTAGDYLHGYMLNSGFSRDIISWHRAHPDVSLHFFWDRPMEGGQWRVDEHLTFHALDDEAFIRYMAGARAYATTAGFESVCEAMYLGKPVLMVPTHIEQLCNAYDAEAAGAGIRCATFDLDRLNSLGPVDGSGFRQWTDRAERLIPEQIEDAVRRAAEESHSRFMQYCALCSSQLRLFFRR